MESLRKGYNYYQLKKLKKIISKIDDFKTQILDLSDEDIRDKFWEFKNNNAFDLIEKKLPLLLAMIGEVFLRKMNIELYDEQYICGLALYFNYIVEMKSGEGKSICAVIGAILQSLNNKVHIITVNDCLAERDCERFRCVYEQFGLYPGLNYREKKDKGLLYESDIVYSSSMELIFDYLRNELEQADKKIKFPLEAVIIDEVDYVLLDNANSTFSISTGYGQKPDEEIFIIAKEVCSFLKGTELTKEEFRFMETEPQDTDYIYCYADSNVYLTQKGITVLEDFFKTNTLNRKNLWIYKIIINTLEANLFYKNGREYIIEDNAIVLINRANGRIMADSQLEQDLHSALEIKENLPLSDKPLLCNSLSYQIFFSKYRSLTGMSGTVYEAIAEFEQIFKTPVIIVPTHNKPKTIKQPDLMFKSKEDKFDFLLRHIREKQDTGQPVLIIASSEREGFETYDMLRYNQVKVNFLITKCQYREIELISKAGSVGTVTISTNMVGRGTDIIIDNMAEELGGLYVISLTRYTSRRIDNQITGRVGRQGQAGEGIFLISMDDEISRFLTQKQKKRLDDIIESNYLDDFNSDSSRKIRLEISDIFQELQDKIQINLYKAREWNYHLDEVIEKQHSIILDWKNEFLKNPLKSLEVYINSNKFNVKYFRRAFQIDKDINIIDEFYSQQKELGENTSKVLLEKLITFICDKHWLVYKRDMEGIKSYLPFYRMDENRLIAEYVDICFDQLTKMQKNIMDDIIGYFISAEVEDK